MCDLLTHSVEHPQPGSSIQGFPVAWDVRRRRGSSGFHLLVPLPGRDHHRRHRQWAGIGGATFFSPLFVIALGLEPNTAIGTALVTEVFGFASGVTAHYRARTIDRSVVHLLLVASVPMAVIGSLLGGLGPERALKTILGVGLPVIAFSFVRHRPHALEDESIARGVGVVEPSVERVIVSSDGHEYRYHVCRRTEGRLFAGVGGALVALVSTRLGELNTYALVKRCRSPVG